MKPELEQLVLTALERLPPGTFSEPIAPGMLVIAGTRDAEHGDFTTNVALRLARSSRLGPRDLAHAIVASLPESPLVERTEVAGAGFINFFLATAAQARELALIHRMGERYGRSDAGRGQRVTVAPVLPDPTGSLRLERAREAAYCRAVSNLLRAVGYDVSSECPATGADSEFEQGLRDEVGEDVCRFFFLMRDRAQTRDFDLKLAKTRSMDNPAYFVQYAHARVASTLKQLAARELRLDLAQGLAHVALLASPHERAALRCLTRYPDAVELAARQRAPHTLIHYLRDLANTLHTFHNAEPFIVSDAKLRNARLALVLGVQQVLRNGLTLLGVSAPETM